MNVWVVWSRSSGPLRLGEDGVLWIASGLVRQATPFQSLKAARAAIQRTVRYSHLHGLGWATDHEVCRLKVQ